MTDHTLLFGSVSALRQQLRNRAVSSEELTRACLDRIEACNGALNAVITVCAEQAIDSAREADKAIARGDVASLTGIPLLHKDIFCTNGVRTTCGSRMLEQFVPAYDATVVSKMQAEGAVMLGKCNMDEFAMGSSNETSFLARSKTPGISIACRVAAPVVPLRRSPRAWRRWSQVPTRAARSGSPPPSVVSPA